VLSSVLPVALGLIDAETHHPLIVKDTRADHALSVAAARASMVTLTKAAAARLREGVTRSRYGRESWKPECQLSVS
jgi:hypothetical protein